MTRYACSLGGKPPVLLYATDTRRERNVLGAYAAIRQSTDRNQTAMTAPMTHAENRIPLYITRADEKKNCASCNRGTHLIFSGPGGLDWRRCRRCLTTEERKALDQYVKVGRIRFPYTEHCLSNLRDPGFE